MNIKKLRLISLILLAMFSINLVGTVVAFPQNQSTPSVTTIDFWYTENDSEKGGVIELVNEFEALNPDIDVNPLQKGFFDAKNLYINAFIAESEPELFRAARDWVPEFATAEMIAPLTDVFNANLTYKNDFLTSALRLVTYPDPYTGVEEIWGFPQLVDTPALMYNKYLFEEAGIDTTQININTSWTWEEFVGNASLLTDVENNQYGFTMAGMFFGAQGVYFGRGANLFSDGIVDVSHIAINSTEARESLTYLKDLIEVEQITPPWNEMGWGSITNLFTQIDAVDDKVAMIQQGPWELKNYLDNSPEFKPGLPDSESYASADNLGIMQLPHDEDGNQGAPLGGHAYVISAFTTGDKYDATVKLAKYMTSERAMALGAIDYYHVPARESIMTRYDVMNADSYEYVLGFKKNVDKAYQVPVHHKWASLEEEFANNIDEYLSDDATLDQCISQTISIWKEMLGQETTTDTVTDSGTGINTDTNNSTLGEETPGFASLYLFLAIPVLIPFIKRKKF